MAQVSNHVGLLASQLSFDMRLGFIEYVRDLLEIDDWYGIGPDFLGFMEDYQDLATVINRHIIDDCPRHSRRNFVIYDVGCATALQHVFFGKCKGYIGISLPGPPRPRFFLPNCQFYVGKFSEVVDRLDIDPDESFGIANMSLLYGCSKEELEAFDRAFKRKFVI